MRLSNHGPSSAAGLVAAAAAVVVAAPGSDSRASSWPYQLRGAAADARFEGTVREPVSGHFTLVSATAYREGWGGRPLPRFLRVRFFSPRPTTAHVGARELASRHSYRMVAARTEWEAGWSEFAWPTADVVAPLAISPDNLGVTVTAKEMPDEPGIVFPAIVFDRDRPARISEYAFVIQSNTGLKPLNWKLYAVAPDGRRARVSLPVDHLDEVPPLRPVPIRVPASAVGTGLHALFFEGEWIGGATGHNVVRKRYDFHAFPPTS